MSSAPPLDRGLAPGDLDIPVPDLTNVVTEDETPVDNVFSEKQQRLLTEPLYTSFRPAEPFVAFANVGLFYASHTPPQIPDALLSLGVRLPDELWEKKHRSYFVWEYGKPPDVVIEVVSNREGGELSTKLRTYASARVSFYVVFDPDGALGTRSLRLFELRAGSLLERPITETTGLLENVGLGLRLWTGTYENAQATWLRWFDATGNVLETGAEKAAREAGRADAEASRADAEASRADAEAQRVARLAEKLRSLGVDPES